MYPNFYQIIHSHSLKKYYRIEEICSGLERIDYCKKEEYFFWRPFDTLKIKLMSGFGNEWPDFLHDYHWENYYIFTENFFSIMEKYSILNIKSYPIELKKQPALHHINNMPQYYIFDGKRISGPRKDYKKSELPNTSRCQECGRLLISTDDTIEKIHSEDKTGLFIDINSWDGQCLFTLEDEMYSNLYCTDDFIDIVSKNKLTNFAFEHLENEKVRYGYRKK